MKGKEFAFVVHLLMFYAIQCQDLKSMRLVMNPSFTSMLLASFQEYIIERNGISRMQCFFLCLQHNSTYAWTLANDEPLQCKLMSSHMNAVTVDSGKLGWSFWDVMRGYNSVVLCYWFTLRGLLYDSLKLYILTVK